MKLIRPILFVVAVSCAGVQVSPLRADSVALNICYNFGCKSQGSVQLSATDISTLAKLFEDIDSAQAERVQIRLAIAQLETITARYLPTGYDVGGNYREGMNDEGKQDCIDESTNTTTYLGFLERQGWLYWHTVEGRVRRAPYLFDVHWAAQIRQRDTSQIYVVDSWFYDNGQPPMIEALADWLDKRDLDGK